MEREKILTILEKQITNKNIIKHMFATEACMKALASRLKKIHKDEGISKTEWAMAGLIHDGDYRDDVPVEQQGVKIVEILEKEGVTVPPAVAQAAAAHNWRHNGREPKSLMDWALFTCDTLTGLIVAATLVLPSKKLADLKTENVLHRFKEKSFARGTRREDILLCQEKLGLSLEEFIDICLKAMQGIADELGL